jgi:hypothetical protein
MRTATQSDGRRQVKSLHFAAISALINIVD